MKILALATLLNILQLSFIAPATEPVTPRPEALTTISSLMAESPFESKSTTMTVTLTAYSSTPEQTDDTPYLTASNTVVRDGVVAANFLPIGTKIQIPKLFGNKVFVVEDRMNKRFDNPADPTDRRLDVWHSEYSLAKQFGIRKATIVVLEG